MDIVRDLMSPKGEERNYKSGMVKDEDGFTDVKWCTSKPIDSWKQLRDEFVTANARKAIAPTQFNHQSTRGHCVMTLELVMPHPEMEGMNQRGRVYVCDLAGTEPAGDVVYALYKKKVFDDGSIEHEYAGPHQDPKKSKELQDQGKKINLSLSEMAQFFMKMAQAVLKKTLKPGKSIPGCNSYFLCKYLKDTMLQARTYLFCAIRPEVKYHNYTFSTLQFAKNASVIKLAPKKAQTAMTPAEKKLMGQLDEMKALVEKLKKEAASGGGGGGGRREEEKAKQDEEMAEMRRQLAEAKAGVTEEDPAAAQAKAEEREMKSQQDFYKKKGIDMYYFCKDTELPYLSNCAEDQFRSNRFMFIFEKEETHIGTGPDDDIKPGNFNVLPHHCKVTKDAEGVVKLHGGAGTVYHNGKPVNAGESAVLAPMDRVVIDVNVDMYVFRYPGKEEEGAELPTADAMAQEVSAAVKEMAMSNMSPEMLAMQAKMKEMEAENARMQTDREDSAGHEVSAEEEHKVKRENAMKMVESELFDLLPKMKKLKEFCDLMDRDALSFDTSMEISADEESIPKVKVKVDLKTSLGSDSIYLDTIKVPEALGTLQDKYMFLRGAIEEGTEYAVEEFDDPVSLLFDNSFHIGTAYLMVEYLIYMFPTEDEDKFPDIKNVIAPYNSIGRMEVEWVPLAGPNPEDRDKEVPDFGDESEVLGQPWTCMIRIKSAAGLPITTDLSYCEYKFNGETFVTESVEQNTSSPAWTYECVHHVDVVTQEFLDYLKRPFQVHVWVNPYISTKFHPITDQNITIRSRAGFEGGTFGGEGGAVGGGGGGGGGGGAAKDAEITRLTAENDKLRARLQEALALAPMATPRRELTEAIEQDNLLNPSKEEKK